MILRRQQFVQCRVQVGPHLVGQQHAACSPVVAKRHRAADRFKPARGFSLADSEQPGQFGHRLMLKRVAQGLVLHSKLPRDIGYDRSLFRLQLHLQVPALRPGRRSKHCTSVSPRLQQLLT